MFNARYSPVAVQAEITGKMQPDLWSFNQRKACAGDAAMMSHSYGGIDQDGNLSIMPGELIVGRKQKNNLGRAHGSPQETGFSSVAGLYYGDKTKEALMRDFYLLGVAKGEYQFGGDNLFGTAPMDHGIGFLRSGSYSINNNGAEDVCAGDLLAWEFPDAPTVGRPRDQNMGNGGHEVDNGLNPRASRNRTGTPYGKPLIQVTRFDPTDFSFQLAGAHALFGKPKARGGIDGLKLKDLTSEEKNLTTLQEEAMGWAYGLIGIGARAIQNNQGDHVRWLNDRIDADGTITKAGKAYLDQIFLRNTTPNTNQPAINALNVPNGNYAVLKFDTNKYEWMADNCLNLLCGSIAGAWYAKASRVIGKAMGNSKSTQTLDVMFSHFKLCA